MHHPPHLGARTPRSRSRIGRRVAAVFAATLAVATGCRPALAPLLARINSTTNGVQTTPAEQFFSAFADRFTNVYREPKVATAREKLAYGALVPSRVFNDTAAWSTLSSPTIRQFVYDGTFTGNRYRMSAAPPNTRPNDLTRPADTRHVITLTQLAPEEFRWDIVTDHSLGYAGAGNIAALFSAFFESAERRAEPRLRADYRATLPRTTATLGKLFSIDSLRTTTRTDGSTLTHVTIAVTPERLRPTYPAFAQYVAKYASPTVMRAVLRGRNTDATWFVADARRNRIDLQFRSRDGRLLPITGPGSAMPDTLALESLVSMRFGIFRVGFENLRSDFIISRGAEPTWTLHFRREPEWKLPLFTEALIRSSLRRPFQDDGALFQISLHDEDGQTFMTRRGHLTVQEGTILRFLSRLGRRAYDDLSARVEKEMQDYLRDIFSAMREDARAVVN